MFAVTNLASNTFPSTANTDFYSTYKSQVLEGLAQEILGESKTLPQSQIPFKVIQYVARNCWESFLDKTLSSYSCEEDKAHSCILTIIGLARIFFGESQSEKVMSKFLRWQKGSLSVCLPSGKHWPYEIVGLLDGCLIYEISKDPTYEDADEEEKRERRLSYLNLYSQKFSGYIQPFVDEAKSLGGDEKVTSKLTTLFSNLKYSFNTSLIDFLVGEMEANAKKTSKSFIYLIGAVVPEAVGSDDFIFDHAFIIEQYYDAGWRFRIYQSWVGTASLFEDLETRKYDEMGHGSWSQPDLNHFIDNLRALYADPEEKNPDIFYQKCFGYESKRLSLVRFENQKLKGYGLRYISAEIDPKNCLENLSDFVISHPDFASSLSQI